MSCCVTAGACCPRLALKLPIATAGIGELGRGALRPLVSCHGLRLHLATLCARAGLRTPSIQLAALQAKALCPAN